MTTQSAAEPVVEATSVAAMSPAIATSASSALVCHVRTSERLSTERWLRTSQLSHSTYHGIALGRYGTGCAGSDTH
ncbi:MAG: hypothetical protein ABIT38_06655 [Gemmatimonadaceae bacterium]